MPKIIPSCYTKTIKLATYSEFFIAVEEGNVKKINELNFTDAHLTAKNTASYTPLHIAILQTNEKMVSWLFEQGADLNLSDDLGYTPLHLAVSMGLENIVKQLLQCIEIDVFKINVHGQTPLQLAISLEHALIINSLSMYTNLLNIYEPKISKKL